MPSASPISQCGLGSKSNFFWFAPGFDGLVVGLRGAGGNFVAGEVGNAGQRLAQLLVEAGRGLVQLVEFVFQGAGLFHHGRGFVVLAGFFQSAHLLAQLIAPGLALFGQGNGLAPALVESAKIAQQRGRVGSPRAQLFFHQLQVGPDKS